MKRRQFIKTGVTGSVAAASLSSPLSAIAAPYNEEILVYIFLRGGIDGFNVVVPLGEHDHEYYSIMRPGLAIPDSGTGAALQLGAEPFGLNPLAGPLKDLYDAGHLAVVNAVGTPDDIATRSHFDAEKYIELGTPGLLGTTSGWLHRHFLSMTGPLDLYPEEIFVPIVAFRNNPPVSLLGNSSALTVWSPGAFRLDNAHWRWDIEDSGIMQLDMLPDIYDLGTGPVIDAGNQALAAEAIMRTNYDHDYSGDGSLPYEDNGFAKQLSDVAQLIKLDLGTRLFTLDYGNWDSHAGQDEPGNYADLLDALSRAVAAFMDDLDQSAGGYADRTTIIIQSEFGRRLYQNNSNGTDHGNGNLMLAVGKSVNGGIIYGDWPGLYPGTADEWVNYENPNGGGTEPELFQGALSVTTDFRRILSEYLEQRCEHTQETRDFVFPGYSGYSPMGIFNPLAEQPDLIFADDFEVV